MTILRMGLPLASSTVVSRYCAGSAAVLVFEDGSAVEDVGLLGVVGRHDHLAGGETFVECGENGVVGVEADAKRGGDGFAGEVVFGGAEAAGEDDDVGARECDEGGAGEVREIVADDGLEGDLDAEVVEAVGEVEGVGVLAEGREHLGAGGDDFSDHVLFCKPFLFRRDQIVRCSLFGIRMLIDVCCRLGAKCPCLDDSGIEQSVNRLGLDPLY